MRLQRRPEQVRRALVLLAVLTVIVVLSLAAYKYSEWMAAEYRASEISIQATEARAFAESGVAYASALLAGNIDTTLNGNPWDNAGVFQGIEVPSSKERPQVGRFSIVSLRAAEEITSGGQAFRFGATDESGKINVNALLALDQNKGDVGKNILMALPNMTEEIANAILDWLDADDTPRTPGGAENETYSGMNPAYRCKNGPLDSLEELLLVQGVTPLLLFGNDRNRNGVLDPDEDDGSGTVNLGWSAYLTVYSRDVNLDGDGNTRINVNDQDLNTLQTSLTAAVGEELANFISAWRQNGGSQISGSGGSSGGSSSGGSGSGGTSSTSGRRSGMGAMTRLSGTDQTAATTAIRSGRTSSGGGRGGGNRISSLWDLVNSQVNVTVTENGQSRTVAVPSPLNDVGQQKQLLPLLLDKCTTTTTLDLPPKVNVNTASQAVLTALKAAVNDPTRAETITDADIQTILGKRPDPSNASAPPDPIYKTVAWLFTEANLPVSAMKKLDKFVTARTQVYRLQAVGYFEKDGPTARLEAVIDTNQGRPRVVYYRDLTELGRAFNFSDNQTR